MIRGENELCAGYRSREHNEMLSGICSCGLFWEGHMPPHDAEGKLIPPYLLEKEQKRKGQRLAQQLVSDADRRRSEEEYSANATKLLAMAKYCLVRKDISDGKKG